ncbi:MAG: GNAT family N-acetyltransferase [Rhodoglobus sp.]
MPDCSVIAKTGDQLTTDELYSFLKLRTDVFFIEQKIDETELDNRDLEPETIHYWIADEVGTAAYLRVLFDQTAEHRDAHRVVGRVVVRGDRRGEGLAQVLFAQVLERFGTEPMMLHAQEYIAPLYAKFGFEAFGDVYQEAGITHVSMYRSGHE